MMPGCRRFGKRPCAAGCTRGADLCHTGWSKEEFMAKKPATDKPGSATPKGSTGFTATADMGLMDCLMAKMPERSRNAIKSLLSGKQVWVGDQNISQFDHPVKAGDRITIRKDRSAVQERKIARAASRNWNKTGTAGLGGMAILYEDDQVIVVNKPAGLLSMGSETEKSRTAHRFLADYVRTKDPAGRIFIVHRLDRDTSGVMLFARSQDIQKALQADWATTVHERRYIALVEGRLEGDQGTLRSWLKENKAQIVYVSREPGDGLEAVTHWKRLGGNRDYTLVELNLETGRKNQIRVQMQEIGHPVAGDAKYGATTNPARRLCLHAMSIGFVHPATHRIARFEVPFPPVFQDIINRL